MLYYLGLDMAIAIQPIIELFRARIETVRTRLSAIATAAAVVAPLVTLPPGQ